MQKPYYEALEFIFLKAIEEKISPDGKLLADAIPQNSYLSIIDEYEATKYHENFNFKQFFLKHFKISNSETETYKTNKNHSIEDHIFELWTILSRKKDEADKMSSLLPLPYPYIVPGGRFKEIYYWDSYFTMLGLQIHQKEEIMWSMVNNFAFLINEYGYIPNGNRKYYLGRSQPPFFSLMVCLLAETLKDKNIIRKYIPHMIKEAQFFDQLSRQKTTGKCTLATYYDSNTTPRTEMYQDDVHIAGTVSDHALFYRNIRAACESGWDFSSRWLDHTLKLDKIQTTDVIPVDLNCLLWNLEYTIATYSEDQDIKTLYLKKSNDRKSAILEVFWSDHYSFFMDYNYKKNSNTNIISCAGLFPLFFGLATQEQVDKMIPVIQKHLVKPGGLITTDINTGQQWDSPNGWAPLQWIGVKGLSRYGKNNLAVEIASAWTSINERVFSETGKLMEKYNVVDITLPAGGGEYQVQDGFGWTNGVYLALKQFLRSK